MYSFFMVFKALFEYLLESKATKEARRKHNREIWENANIFTFWTRR